MFPRGDVHPHRGKTFTPRGTASTLRNKVQPWGQILPKGSNFAPMGEIKTGLCLQEALWRMNSKAAVGLGSAQANCMKTGKEQVGSI
jgi:hypothetical protein